MIDSSSPTSVDPQGGYTLLEVLITLSVVGFLSLGLVANIGLGARVWERTDSRSDAISQSTALERVFRQHVDAAVPIEIGDVAGDVRVFFEGDPRHLRFFSEVANPTSGSGIFGVDIEIVIEAPDARIVFRRGYAAFGRNDLAGSKSWDVFTLDLAVASPRFVYLAPDETGRELIWQESWRNQFDLPHLVSLSFDEASSAASDETSAAAIIEAPDLNWSAIQVRRDAIDAYFSDING